MSAILGIAFHRVPVPCRGHRADKLADMTLDVDTVAGWRYGQAPAAQYAKILADEAEQFIDMPLADALRTEPPSAFRELANRDAGRVSKEQYELS